MDLLFRNQADELEIKIGIDLNFIMLRWATIVQITLQEQVLCIDILWQPSHPCVPYMTPGTNHAIESKKYDAALLATHLHDVTGAFNSTTHVKSYQHSI